MTSDTFGGLLLHCFLLSDRRESPLEVIVEIVVEVVVSKKVSAYQPRRQTATRFFVRDSVARTSIGIGRLRRS